jgi:short-subunit dehydrogenase
MRTTLITGASGGIGEALACELARRGWRRFALTARRAEMLDRVASSLRDLGAEVITIPCDVRDGAAIKGAADAAIAKWGAIDVAIANAGIAFPTPAKNFKIDDVKSIMQTNFDGMIHLFDAVIAHWLERGAGHFVGVASIAGLRGLPGSSAYSASKAAMQAWLEATRIELAGRGITVTTVNPGFVATPMVDKNKNWMPFLMDADSAARRIATGIEARARVVEFPLRMSIVMRIARLLPSAIWDAMSMPYARRKIDVNKVRR